MKKNIKVQIIILLMFMSVSCNTFLNIKPVDILSADQALVTYEDFVLALRGCYSGLTFNTYYGGDFFALTEVPSGNVKRGLGNAGQYTSIYNLNYTSGDGDVEELFLATYRVIFRVNSLLQKVDGMQEVPSQAEKNKLIAEALMLRALAHHDAVRLFAKPYNATADASHPGVTIKLTPDISFPARNTVKEVYTQIKADIQKALPGLSDDMTFGSGTFTKRAATAFLARIAYYERDWLKVLEYTTDAIGTSLPVTGTVYSGMWTGAGQVAGESLFKLQFRGTTAMGTVFYDRGGNTQYFEPTTDLTSLYTGTDVRLNLFAGLNAGRRVVTKHQGSTAQPGIVDVKMFRLSELYLMRAEAKIRNSNPDQAAALVDLNAVRTARLATPGTEAGADLLPAIKTEWRKEFAFEGFLWFDYINENQSIVRADNNAVNPSLPAGNFRFTFPIPFNEVRANSAQVQNPGY